MVFHVIEQTLEVWYFGGKKTSTIGWQVDDLLFGQTIFSELSHELLNFNWIAAEKVREVFENVVDYGFPINFVIKIESMKHIFHVFIQLNT